ncbi:putative abc multidrug protein [Phaeoacremonium minimum UCRPA7]|uniref:Putative abc multidrug protein n=1 Tax=Phaeoacremonium minimum (strain UCR-PA7) TaxID=1286976 RepID=R8B9Q7_PHAM7|nr:putative abc multidrug protein [Phaeoacremonium minimum UCRPA7]EON96040.1 putative abc multidrug protein [Phaeoacremonium minimum UCRPA7]
MKFALRNKVPRDREEHLKKKHHYVQEAKNSILDTLGIGHAKKTKVGNEFIRGVSGGERKRVSLAEMMAGQSPMQFWDQPTRGLDSKTALEFATTLRKEADRNGKTVVATLYQAGNSIFDKFDKVLVLADGLVIYYGPRSFARQYFESLGFICPKGANIADFLTSVTVKTERVVSPEAEGKVPTTAEEFETAYKNSVTCQQMKQAERTTQSLEKEVQNIQLAVESEKKQRRVGGKRSVYTVGLKAQIVNCTIRQFQIMMGDRLSIAVKVFSAIVQALAI